MDTHKPIISTKKVNHMEESIVSVWKSVSRERMRLSVVLFLLVMFKNFELWLNYVHIKTKCNMLQKHHVSTEIHTDWHTTCSGYRYTGLCLSV